MKTYNWYTMEEITKLTWKSYNACYWYIYRNKDRTIAGIKRMTRYKPTKLYNGLTIKQISKKTKKSTNACICYIRRHPDRTLEKIKNANMKRHRFLIDWLTLQEYSKKVGITPSALWYQIREWRLEWNIVDLRPPKKKKHFIY